jgi:hypothetical protein
MAKRVYFAFDYEDVSDFRANVVRNHNFTGGVEKAGYFDASMWEEAKKKDPTSLKRLINAELENTSVTAVLIGSGTYARRWVRYEIVKSIERGNKVIGQQHPGQEPASKISWAKSVRLSWYGDQSRRHARHTKGLGWDAMGLLPGSGWIYDRPAALGQTREALSTVALAAGLRLGRE